MSFILGQYNKNFDNKNENTLEKNNIFMKIVNKPAEAKRRHKVHNNDVFNDQSSGQFEDECVTYNGLLKANETYYFHGQIRKMKHSPQRFDIKLVNYDQENGDEQYIKTIDIDQGYGSGNEWVDVEFIFTAAADFDTILFELTRNVLDYSIGSPRVPAIVYEELSVVNNLIDNILQGYSFNKIGIQSHPGLVMCINGEQIRIGRTGIYELKNGIINVSKFSVINASTETGSRLFNYKEIIDDKYRLDGNNNDVSSYDYESDITKKYSKCFFSINEQQGREEKDRKIDAFTLDYMYEKGGE